MKQRYILFTLLACLLLSSAAFGQKAKLKRANHEYKQLNFQRAIVLYLEILDNTDNADAKINLADAYRKVGNTAESEYWYGQIVYLPDAKPIYKLYYAKALQANGKCDLAKEWFQAYSKDVPDDWRGRLLAQACEKDKLKVLTNAKSKFYEIEGLPFNTAKDDFGPAIFKNGLVFSSERDEGSWKKRTHTWTGNPFLEIFFTEVDTLDADNFEFTYEKNPGKYSDNKLNSKFHDGPLCFSRDYKKVYFTRNNIFEGKTNRDDDGIVRLKIFSGDLVNGKWENLEGLPFNSDEYSVAHPAITPDGRTLYFASDMPGGFGGMDLWVTHYDNGQWSPPTNLGPRINTEGNEIFPYYHISNKLYFSSDGQLGLGGLDVFYVQDLDKDYGPIINMGAPLNSTADDFGMVLNDNETYGYFSSDRTGGVGNDDIYAFKLNIVDVDVLVYDELTGDPIAGASVYDACSEITFTTGADGIVTIQMPTKECCKFSASKSEYKDNTEEACTRKSKPGDRMLAKIPLRKPLEFALVGTVTHKETGVPLAGVTVTLMSDMTCGGEKVTFTTDADGKYRFDLDSDCCYRVRGEKENHLAHIVKTDICAKGKTKSEVFVQDLQLMPYAGDDIFADNNPDAEIPSVPFVLEHVYYDFDKSYLREESKGSLGELLKIMQDNPTIIVEIGSHTDARGSDRYNQKLSERRAKSVVEYLITQGIPKERLTYVGYGEEQPTNDCVNEVKCDEDEHQRNRRTEFRVIGTLDGKTFTQSSQKPTVIRTDACKSCPF